MQFGNFVKIISSFTHWIFQDSSMYSNQPLESEMQKIFVTKSLLSNPFLESTFLSKKIFTNGVTEAKCRLSKNHVWKS